VNIDDLTGRELDAMVAQRLFGLEVEARTNTRTSEKDVVCRQPGKQWVRVTFYSRSMGASLNVELAARDRGWQWTGPRERTTADVRVVLEHADGRTVEAFGPVNEALCRAALKAVEET
jgi:hypothetical protein